MSELTQEQKVNQVKVMLMQQMGQVYAGLANFVKQLPIDEKIKEFSLMNLDQGIMWIEQGIKKLNFVVEDKPNAEPNEPVAAPETPAAETQACNEPTTQPEGDAA